MICNNCKKEITDDSKFCEHCGNSIIKRKSDNRLIIDKRIILIIVFPLIGIVVTCIGMHIYKNSNGLTTNPINTSNQDIKNNVIIEDLEVQENNGYKTFNFTIDDVINAYLIKEDKVLFDKNGAYCQSHLGTTRAILLPDSQVLTEYEKYVEEIDIIYEDISRKVISINTPLMGIQLVAFLTDNNMELTDNWVEEAKNNVYQYMLSLLARVKKQLKNLEVLGDASNSKFIYTSTNTICGRYKMIEENIGLVQSLTEKPINFYLIIRATDEDEFYNSTVNELLDVSATNMYNEVEQENKKSETFETSKNYDTITEQDKQTQNYDTIIEQNVDKDNDSNNSYKESKPFSMPYLIGYSEEYARDVLKQCGLKANFIYAPDSNQIYGIVLSQSVEPNELVYEGETISVTINNDIKTSELTLSIWPFDFVPKDTSTAKVVIIINDNIVFEKNVNLDSNATMESTVVEESFDLYNENKIQVLINEKEVYTNTKNFGVNGNSNDRWVITKS